MRVALVHGIFDTGHKFRRLQAHLEVRGHRCVAPTLTPNDGRDGLQPLAQQLAFAIDACWALAENRRIPALCHACLLWHPQLLADIAVRLERPTQR